MERRPSPRHLLARVLFGASCGTLYATLTMTPDIIGHCFGYGLEGGCRLLTYLTNFPLFFIVGPFMESMRYNLYNGLWSMIIFLVGDAMLFALFNFLVGLRWKNMRMRTVIVMNFVPILLFIVFLLVAR